MRTVSVSTKSPELELPLMLAVTNPRDPDLCALLVSLLSYGPGRVAV
jgi:hypothetical protein